MACIKLYGKNLSQDEVNKANELALQAGSPEDTITAIEEVGEPDPDCDDEIILVLATEAVCALSVLEAEFSKAQNGARRVICVWPEGASSTELPPAAAKYCYSIVPWDVEKLKQVFADDDVTILETPTGEPIPKVDTDRNLCVEAEVKTK